MSSCVIPGSFDPVTTGHMNLISRAARIFDRVTVTVMINVHKAGSLTPDQRKEFLERSLRHLPNVKVDLWKGLLAEYMLAHGENCIIRGSRNATEFDAEKQSAEINRMLAPSVTTLIMPAEDSVSCVSSSAIRELIRFGGDPKPFLPPETAEDIVAALSNHYE
jgi:pantetheine-phosphate adenylyltransferase